MTNKIRNEFAVYGLDILKRSVLLVLYKENLAGEHQLADKITKRLGLSLPPYHNTGRLVAAILERLQFDGLVDSSGEITPEGMVFIEVEEVEEVEDLEESENLVYLTD